MLHIHNTKCEVLRTPHVTQYTVIGIVLQIMILYLVLQLMILCQYLCLVAPSCIGNILHVLRHVDADQPGDLLVDDGGTEAGPAPSEADESAVVLPSCLL